MLTRLPIRWRLAITSALLTFAILTAFAMIVGTLTTRRIERNFRAEVSAGAEALRLKITLRGDDRIVRCEPPLDVYVGAEHAALRLVRPSGEVLCQTKNAPNFGAPTSASFDRRGYRVDARPLNLPALSAPLVIQYGRERGTVDRETERLWILLAAGVASGTLLALLSGVWLAWRSLRPIAALTRAASRIERTRDTSVRLPEPNGHDEVAQLAETLRRMLAALDASRAETELALERQREFLADASHELRTPLTSVLGNLEQLVGEVEGAAGEETAASALRSTERMCLLVNDMLVLARTDAGQLPELEEMDLSEVIVEVLDDLSGLATGHELELEIEPAAIRGSRDELHRLVRNLIANAFTHTPAQTKVSIRLAENGDKVRLEVADEGPGIAEEMRSRIFERFVRGSGDRGGSSGIGLAIVKAVTEAHGGYAWLEPSVRGAHFVCEFPALPGEQETPA